MVSNTNVNSPFRRYSINMRRIVEYVIPAVCFLMVTLSVQAQQLPGVADDFDAPVDTPAFYKKLYNYSKDRKLLYFIYRGVFNPPSKSEKSSKVLSRKKALSEKDYRGKTIRNIRIMSLEPFGTSINVTS